MKNVIKKAVAKAPVKKTVAKKPMMKMGGAKKPLRKAQDGMFSGPLRKEDMAAMDKAYPSTTNYPTPYDPNYRTGKNYNFNKYNQPAKEEAESRKLNEDFLRMPKQVFDEYKKGGSVKKTVKKGGVVKKVTAKKVMVKSKKK